MKCSHSSRQKSIRNFLSNIESALELLIFFLQKNPKKPQKSQAHLYGEDIDENLSSNLLFDDGTKSGDNMESDDDADDESTHGDSGNSNIASDVDEFDDDYMDDVEDAEDSFDDNQSDEDKNTSEDDNIGKIKDSKSK